MNTNKKAALAKRIDETKKKIAGLRETKPAVPSLGVAFLIEAELEKANLIMAAKNITSDLQTQAEKLAKIEADQVMPIIDQMKSTFGNEAAESFYKNAIQSIRDLVDQVQRTKDTINDQIMQLENGSAGLPMNDMAATDDGEGDDLDMGDEGDDMGDDLDMGDEGDDDMGDHEMDGAGADAPPADNDEFANDNFEDDMATAAGRARKESAEKFEKAILEFFKRAVRAEGYRPTAAAKVVAEGFGVDVADVRTLVTEAAKAKEEDCKKDEDCKDDKKDDKKGDKKDGKKGKIPAGFKPFEKKSK